MGHFYFSLDSFAAGIANQAELIKREKPCEREADRDRRKQEGSFSFSYLESSLFLKLPSSEKRPPPLPNFTFFFLVPASPPHKPTLYEWLASFSSTPAPPPFSHWLFHSLCPTTPPSFPFSSPLLFLPFLFIAGCSRQPAESQRAPLSVSHWSSFKTQLSSEKLRLYSKGSIHLSLKVQKQLLLLVFYTSLCVCRYIYPSNQKLGLCVWMSGKLYTCVEASVHKRKFAALCIAAHGLVIRKHVSKEGLKCFLVGWCC